jgi:lipoate-protein ligase B
MKLRHISIPGLSHYSSIGHLQSSLISSFLAHKHLLRSNASTTAQPPAPTIITSEMHPVYTAGLRERTPPETIARLKSLGAEFQSTSRGGQLTFHGPGQLVAYPILDLKRHGLSTPCYVHALEDASIAVCKRYGIEGKRTENVGVWVGEEGEERKIAAVGVRLRRFVSGHGMGFNVSTDLGWFGEIVACGLADRSATSLVEEGVKGVGVGEVGRVFVEEMARRLKGVDGVVEMSVEELREELDIHDDDLV